MGEFGIDWESFCRVLGDFGRVLETLGDFWRLWESFDRKAPPGVEPVAQFDSTWENFGRDWESFCRIMGKFGRVLETLGDSGRLWESFD